MDGETPLGTNTAPIPSGSCYPTLQAPAKCEDAHSTESAVETTTTVFYNTLPDVVTTTTLVDTTTTWAALPETGAAVGASWAGGLLVVSGVTILLLRRHLTH